MKDILGGQGFIEEILHQIYPRFVTIPKFRYVDILYPYNLTSFINLFAMEEDSSSVLSLSDKYKDR